jgi:hypothetical protein
MISYSSKNTDNVERASELGLENEIADGETMASREEDGAELRIRLDGLLVRLKH